MQIRGLQTWTRWPASIIVMAPVNVIYHNPIKEDSFGPPVISLLVHPKCATLS